MTVPSTVSRVSYGGNGSSVAFPISFYFLANADIVCLLVDPDGNSTTQILNTHYTLTGAGVASGGTLTMLTAPPTGYTLIIYRDPALTQLTDYEPNDPFPAETHERALDRLTMIAQRLKDMFTRTVQLPESDISGVSVSIPSPVAGRGLKWNSLGTALINSANDPDTVVSTASGYADSAAVSATSAAGSATSAATSYDAFDDRYLGSKSADPTVDNDGNALLTGALYWSTATNKLRIYNGSSWQDTATATPASFTPNTFSGNASTTAFTLSTTPASTASVLVFISGVAQRPTTDFTLSGMTITFTSAPPAGTNNIFVLVASTVAAGTPDNSSVSTAKLQDGAVTTPKIADGAVTLGKLDSTVYAALVSNGLFRKNYPSIVAFTKTGAGTAVTASILYVEVNAIVKTIASGTAITMPTLTVGTDYAVWAKTDGTLEATSNHTSPPTANARRIGGFHYAAGGNATANAGGNTTPQINEYSFWDLKFRPACQDPRGMALVADGFWADIYLCGVDHITNGTSKYNVTMADGASPPKKPIKFGGNGSTAYTSMNWWEATEVLFAYGKRAPTYSEFAALAFGTTEASSIGTDQNTTQWNAAYVSKWGINQASGVLWVWGNEFGGGAAAASWAANTGGRGSSYQMENVVLFGGSWGGGAYSGSRCSDWSGSPTTGSANYLGVRGVADHLQLD